MVSPPASFTFPVRVYYEDTDTGGIVFYANYLKFFERARSEWLRTGVPGHAGVSQQQVADALGLMFVVRSTAVEYRRPARLDDMLRVVSTVERVGRVGIDFHQAAYLDPPTVASASASASAFASATATAPLRATGDAEPPQSILVAVGRIKVGCVSRDTLKPSPIPDAIRLIFCDR